MFWLFLPLRIPMLCCINTTWSQHPVFLTNSSPALPLMIVFPLATLSTGLSNIILHSSQHPSPVLSHSRTASMQEHLVG